MNYYHVPVLLDEVIEGLNLKSGKTVVDCTLGAGGHAVKIAEKIKPYGLLIAVDKDEEAVAFAKERLKGKLENIFFFQEDYKKFSHILEKKGIDSVDAVLMDLGVSSCQIDSLNRGFSYMQDAPLDMRIDKKQEITAEKIVNELSEEELSRVFWEYGEEKFARRIAKKIVSSREEEKITTTSQLVRIIDLAIPEKEKKKKGHSAKKVFQALRIKVNNELQELDKAIESAVNYLTKEGRIAVITFHSLEDRIVKNTFKMLAAECICPPKTPICRCGKEKKLKILTKKPIVPSKEELRKNPRAGSAKLRIGEKV